jgi:parallel beta-helix repeat protein
MNRVNSTLVVLFFLWAFLVSPQIEVKAEWKTIVVPDDYSTIQEAIDYAVDSDIIFVKHGIYNENLTISKSLSLIGENEFTTIINGGNIGTAILIIADHVTVCGFTVKNGESPTPPNYMAPDKTNGIHLLHVNYCNITNNIVEYNGYGIWLYSSFNNQVTENNCTNNWDGIRLEVASNNYIAKNKMETNHYGIRFDSSLNNTLRNNILKDNTEDFIISEDSFFNNVDSSNKIKDKPIYYWINQSNKIVPSDAGLIILVNCTQIIIHDINIQNSYYAIIFVDTKNSTIKNSILSDNYYGIWFYNSSKNLITENTFINNGYPGAINLDSSSNNMIVRNNFTGNFYALKLVHSSYNRILENYLVDGSNEAIAIFDACKYNNITGNNIQNNRGGIWFQYPTAYSDVYYSNYNYIVSNNIDSNTDWGILLQTTVQNFFSENNITNNGKGVYLNAREPSNQFYLNNFVNNSVHVEHWGVAQWNNGSIGNYWDDYEGKDNNGDGKGDAPYIIDENNQDYYPLMNPVEIEVIPEFPSWIPNLTMLVIVMLIAVVYRLEILNRE